MSSPSAALSALTLDPRPSEGYVFTTQWPVRTSDMNENEILGYDSAARYLQEAGALHLADGNALGDHEFWIARRTVIDMIEPISWPNTVTVSRWCSGLSSRWCDMRVQIVGDHGGRVETVGFWLNINIETEGIGRMSDYVISRLSTTTDNTRLRWKPMLTEPLPTESTRTFQIRRSDTDRFGHVTNAIYWQAVAEVAPEVAELVTAPHRLVVEFNKPIMYGQEVHLTTAPIDDGLLVWLSVDGESRSHASITALAA
ncbi:MAG: thioesterase [Corynebacteriales bacterium]|nr:thioesterase [Mycobacteriales bacterium]